MFSSYTSELKDYRSNIEAVNGFADIQFYGEQSQNAVIIEIKWCDYEDKLNQSADMALAQIERMLYEQRLKSLNFDTIYCYGISFYKKNCVVKLRKS